jgi:NAD(P)-dependent dehydrogenase (short-subunit alcohol dehydrogenase family)
LTPLITAGLDAGAEVGAGVEAIVGATVATARVGGGGALVGAGAAVGAGAEHAARTVGAPMTKPPSIRNIFDRVTLTSRIAAPLEAGQDTLLRWVDVKLEGQVALLTGGGGAMGGAQARLLAREGAAVCLADLFLEKADGVAADIIAADGRALARRLDVRDSAEWAATVAAAEREFGPISILCNNAGANFRVGFDEQSEDMWNMLLGTMLTGSFLGIKAVVPSMRRRGGGVIVNLGSLASIRPGAGSPGYAAAKTGLVGLTRSAALSYAGDGIRCVLVAPGHVDTPFIRANTSYSPNSEETSIDNPRNYDRRRAATPLGRLQTPEDIAKAVLFVVSDDAAMITGSTLTIDGGAAL